MTKKRVTRKQLLKEPDEFITTTGKLIQWAKNHRDQLVYGTALFFGVVILAAAWGYYQERRNRSATALYSQVMTTYQAQGGESEAVKALAAVRTDFDLLVDKYENQAAGRLGRIMYGHMCLAGNALDDAAKHYKAALDDFKNDIALSNLIRNGLGATYFQKGSYPEAIEQFEKIAAGESPVLKDTALFHLGRLYEQLGQSEKSQKAYQQLNTDFPETTYAQLVRDKVVD